MWLSPMSYEAGLFQVKNEMINPRFREVMIFLMSYRWLVAGPQLQVSLKVQCSFQLTVRASLNEINKNREQIFMLSTGIY